MSSDALTDDEYVLKHVNAVALMPVQGGRRISLLGRRLFNVLLHRAQGMGELDEYEARLHEVVTDAAYNSKDTAPIRKVLRELMSTTVEWQSPSHGEIETWDACNLLSGTGITKNNKTGAVTVRWRYDLRVREQLLSPDRYARLSLEAITSLSTHAAMALYEICARYVDNPRHRTARRHWRWWRPVLTGVASDPAKAEYRFFKRDVIRKAIAEINACTPLEVRGPIEYKEQDNRTISDIQFEVFLKAAQTSPEPSKKPLESLVVADLPALGRAIAVGVKQQEAEDLIQSHGTEAFSRAVEQLQKRQRMPAEKIPPVLKPGGWLREYLSRRQPDVNAEGEGAGHPTRISTDDLSKQKAALTDEWLRRRKQALRADFGEFAVEHQEELLSTFKALLRQTSQPQMLRRLESSGWQHKMVIDAFTRFLGERMIGEGWDKPTSSEILDVALGQASR